MTIVDLPRCPRCGQVYFTDEIREEHEKWHDPAEVREKRRAAARAAWSDPEVREKRRAALARPEVREKMRAAARAAWSDPEVREKRRAAARAAWSDPEVREKRQVFYRARKIDRLRQQLSDLGAPVEELPPPATRPAFTRLEDY